MKPIVSLLLVLLFASCGKQEEFVFKKEYEDFVDLNYRYWERQGEKEDPKSNIYSIRIEVEFTFEPVDDEGFTFVEYKITASEEDLQKYNINGLRKFNFSFWDKKERELFEFYAPKTGLNSGKTEHSRALLERVDYIHFSVEASKFEKGKFGTNEKELFLIPMKEDDFIRVTTDNPLF